MRVLLLIPPMTQLNTPYPSTAYIKGYLNSINIPSDQHDLSLELALRIFSKNGLSQIASQIEKKLSIPTKGAKKSELLKHFLHHKNKYLCFIDPVVTLLQGRDSGVLSRLSDTETYPKGPQFKSLEDMAQFSEGDSLSWAFGSLGDTDRAKYLASLMIADLAAIVKEGVDPRFEMVRWGESLSRSAGSFDPLLENLESKTPTLLDSWLDEIVCEKLKDKDYDLVGITTPFPGNVYGAFRIARQIKKLRPKMKIVLGGGWVNTELRSLKESRVFDYFDFVTLDDGETPLRVLIEHLKGKKAQKELFRTYVCDGGKVKLISQNKDHDVPSSKTGFPTYEGLLLDRYLGVFEVLNPMHRLWSQSRWNKLTLAHGCYWKKCSFCDVSLDYIGRYEPTQSSIIVERMEKLFEETGGRGFHFVDEAAPPKLLGELSDLLIKKNLLFSWWGNIRFEKSFDEVLTKKMAKAGCIAVTGGLEVASDRLLKMMDKGVTVEQVARVSKNFIDSGILVHAYLMYGFPSETLQESIDSLERVRQLFQQGCLQSAFWHRFSATTHSPIGMQPEKFGIKILGPKPGDFARNDLDFEDPTQNPLDLLEVGLKKALYNYMHGVGLEEDVRTWFEELKVPKPKVAKNFIENALR